jgi:uncharacterized membrane protein YgcG
MEIKRSLYLFLFVVLILIFSSCHPRHVSDIKLAMTKEEVVSLWGGTNLITYKTTNGTTLETWKYHFAGSGSICQITFIQDRVAANPQCNRPPVVGSYYSQSGQTKPGPRSNEQNLIREGFFAMKLVEALNIGPAKSEAEAENILASIGIAPKNGWIADYPVTPDIIGELQNAIAAAADSGKIAMIKSEAIGVFEDLVTEIESQYVRVEPSPGREPYPETYYYSSPYPFYYRFLYPYPYYDPYPYYYGGYYDSYRHYYYPHRYPSYHHGGSGSRGFHGGSRGGGGSHGGSRGGSGSHGGGRGGRR